MNPIDKITEIRENNNRLWMDILRIAYEFHPIRTKKVIEKILKNDRKINDELEKLVR